MESANGINLYTIMSKTLKARLKIAVVSIATTVSISGALVALPQIARGATLADLMAQLAQLQAQITALQGGSTGTHLERR